jgi:Na+-translocating ferredoxin:NAD+ oxidoreductase subunit B
MSGNDKIYRRLQQHLDNQAIGFPATLSGADIRLLKRLFTPEEARLALFLSYEPSPLAHVAERASAAFSAEQTEVLLDAMLQKGSIARKKKAGEKHWYLAPLVVGMYEAQDGEPSREFLADARAYMKTLSFGRSFLAVQPSQMRTIPINRSLSVEHHVSTYDAVRSIVLEASGPFVVLTCICRESHAIRKEPCKKTSRRETCLAFNHMASMVLARNHGREITRDEVLAILEQNEKDGLVLQPANAKKPDFICSCCGCCCGMLGVQKMLPRPVDFWTVSYQAESDPAKCTRCGKCVSRCQVGAVELSVEAGKAKVNLDRCIGCGLCVTTCPSQAMNLRKKEAGPDLAQDEEEYLDRVMANKKGTLGQTVTAIKMLLGMRR